MPTSPSDEPPLEAVDFYSRRGCVISSMLQRALERREIPMRCHDIWADDAAAARVRTAARGSETVPTVGIGSTLLVNPRVREVLAALERLAPNIAVEDPPLARFWARLRRGAGRAVPDASYAQEPQAPRTGP